LVSEKQRKARENFIKNWAGKKRVTKTGKSKSGKILSANEIKAKSDALSKAFSDFDQKNKELEKKNRIMILDHIRNTRRQLGIRSKTKIKGLTAKEMRYVNSW
tara:strand:- start:306 stop:614 length:309 start_codon:yes stop_codon:yes gene_type:complete